MFDHERFVSELGTLRLALEAVAAGPRGAELRAELGDHAGTTPALLRQALFADCLRVVYTALLADGRIDDSELETLFSLLYIVAKHYAGVSGHYADYGTLDQESSRWFLERYSRDSGLFGYRAPRHWPGLALCQRAAALGASEPLQRYERFMTWLIEAACQVGGVSDGDARQRERTAQLSELRRSLARTTAATAPVPDTRLEVFLGAGRVFHSVQSPATLAQEDPFDVETIHAEARAAFEQLVQHARLPSRHGERGRILLVLGDSGAGKTHLLRAFRRHVHEFGHGFAAYAQLQSASEDYARYLLQHVVDSLALPYAGLHGERTALVELATGLTRVVDEPVQARIRRLASDDWGTDTDLAAYVNALVDDLLAAGELTSFDPDLLRVLLYALRPDPRVVSRVYRYLRCEDLNPYDRAKLGDVIPRTGADHPRLLLRDLARLTFATQQVAFVLMVDQAELAGFDETSQIAFRRAIDALHYVASEVPSAVAVIACLSDLYRQVSPQLTRSAIDRLETDPPVQRLAIARSYPEIEQMVARRLSWLYARSGAEHRAEDPVYPFPRDFLRSLAGRRSRDVLDRCHGYQERCSAAGRLLEADLGAGAGAGEPPPRDGASPSPTPPGPEVSEQELALVANAWNEALHSPQPALDSDEELLTLLEHAARFVAEELELPLVSARVGTAAYPHLRLSLGEATKVLIGIANRSYHGGAFAKQLEALLAAAGDEHLPVAVRTTPFPSGAATDKAKAHFLKARGRTEQLPETTIRGVLAFQRFGSPASELAFRKWRRTALPVASQPHLCRVFAMDEWLEQRRNAPADAKPAAPGPAAAPPADPPAAAPPIAARPAGDPPAAAPPTGGPPPTSAASQAATTAAPADPQRLYLGTSAGFHAEPRWLAPASLLRHTGILGSAGSGKTTLALNLLEQLLERDVAVVLVDRKGDLAAYANATWWQRTADPERARRLAERVDVRLFTPGMPAGRPLSLSVVPDLQGLPDHEKDRMIQYSAHSLAAMMHLGENANDQAQRVILAQAIAVLAESGAGGDLDRLISLIEERDDALIQRASRYDDRLFKKLVQHLETMRLSSGELFDADAEVLSGDTLLARHGGKVPLTIASTRFLGEIERVQSWVASLISALARHATRHPSPALSAVLMIDEADIFLPAGASKPPSKEPLQDLLKRARSAGLGVVLASQSPGDFDYKSRELINTWFLGRIGDAYSIGKMEALFERKPAIASKLGTLEMGRFVFLQEGQTSELSRAPSLMRTEQLSEQELMELAAATRRER